MPTPIYFKACCYIMVCMAYRHARQIRVRHMRRRSVTLGKTIQCSYEWIDRFSSTPIFAYGESRRNFSPVAILGNVGSRYSGYQATSWAGPYLSIILMCPVKFIVLPLSTTLGPCIGFGARQGRLAARRIELWKVYIFTMLGILCFFCAIALPGFSI